MDKKKTGTLIREARIRKNYTQSELGDLIGVSNKAVSRWENGETFPDIGVLENLSRILDLPIQDIVVGEKQADDETVCSEIVRLAKLQEGDRRKKAVWVFMESVIVICSCIAGYQGIKESSLVSGTFGIVSMVMLTGTFFLLLMGKKVLRDASIRKKDNRNRVFLCISAITGIVAVLSTYGMMWLIERGSILFHMEAAAVGQFLNFLYALFFLINFVMLLVQFYRIHKEKTGIGTGIFVSVTVLYLTALYGDMLHRLTTFSQAYGMLFGRTAGVLGELLIVMVLVTCNRKQIEIDQNANL